MRFGRSFFSLGHWPTLLSAFVYFDVSFMIWVLLGALGNHIASDFGLSPSQKGFMTAIPLLGGSILRLVFGHLTDTIGAKKTGCIGLALTFVPLVLGWLWADSVQSLYVVGLLLGVAGASFAVALPLASRWYPASHQGLALGIAGAGNSGTLLATLLAPRLAEQFGWHAVFGLAILPLAAAAALFALLAREAPGTHRSKGLADFLVVLKQRDTYVFGLFYGVTFGGFVGLASFLSIYLRDQYQVSPVAAGDLASICLLAGSLLRPVGGWLADRMGGVPMLSLLFGSIALLALGVAQMPGLKITVVLFVLLMGCFGLGNGSVFQLVPQRFGQHVGVATGILGAAGGLGGFFLPTLLGSIKELTGSYAPGLMLLVSLAVVALAALGVVQSSWMHAWLPRERRASAVSPANAGAEPALS